MPDPDTGAVLSLDTVRKALALSDFDAAAAHLRMAPQPRPFRREDAPGNPRLAGVLILLYPVDGVLTLVLMRRPEYNGVHSGQISLPGGKREGDETFEQTALRETFEELGVSEPVEILGSLTPIYVPPSDFEIHPIVGTLPSRPTWNPDPIEVAGILELPLHALLDQQIKGTEDWVRADRTLTIYFYRIGEYKVWGATAIILSEFEERLLHALAVS